MKTIQVKTWGKDQGDFVLINEEDFDPDFHELLDAADSTKVKALSIDELRAALTEKGIEFPADAKKAELKALFEAAE